MKALQRSILEQLVAGSAEPIVVAQISSPDWPVVLCNPAFENVARTDDVEKQPFADVIEQLVGRELALEISETIRTGQETTIPVEIRNQEFLLVLKPIEGTAKGNSKYYAGFLRIGAGAVATGDQEVQQALLKAKRQIRDLSRDDPVTGLLNSRTFKTILDHDWAVAKREGSTLALVAFTLDDFDKYREVFGRHAADTCQRRVAQAIRRCLKRASDVAARVKSDAGDKLVVLSHSSDETGVREFALNIAASVRELGLHHPRSRVAKFVTVSYATIVKQAGTDKMNAEDFLKAVLE
jgi:diguanylate cyclase (GGDEF)-like protein